MLKIASAMRKDVEVPDNTSLVKENRLEWLESIENLMIIKSVTVPGIIIGLHASELTNVQPRHTFPRRRHPPSISRGLS
jgi:hypothetical protein